MAGTLTVTGLAAGLLSGEKVIGPLTMTGSDVIGTITDVALVSGDNTIVVPSGARACLVVMPTASTVAVKVRTNVNSSDTGLPFGPDGWMVLPLPSGVSELVVNAAGSVPGIEVTFV